MRRRNDIEKIPITFLLLIIRQRGTPNENVTESGRVGERESECKKNIFLFDAAEENGAEAVFGRAHHPPICGFEA